MIVIPCRAGSKRLPGKNKMLLGGKPLFTYAVDDALACSKAGSIAISTDDKDIIEEAEKRYYNKLYVIRRDPRYATDESPIQEALSHAKRCIDLAGVKFNGVMWLQANVVLRPKGIVAKCMDLFLSGSDSVVTVQEAGYNPFWTYQIKDGKLYYPWEKSKWHMLREKVAFRRQDTDKHYVLDGGVQIVKTELLEKKGGLHPYLGENCIPVACSKGSNIDVDDEEDFKKLEAMVKGGHPFEPSG